MRIYKAFLINELIILKRNLKWSHIFFLISIGFVIAPFLNRYSLGGIHYSENLAGALAFGGMLLSISMFVGIFSLSSTNFERTEGMHYFLFAQGIPKVPYMLAKIIFSLSLAVVVSIIPLALYYGTNLYQNFLVSQPIVLMCIIAFTIIWTLISMIFAHVFYSAPNISLVSLCVASLFIAGFTGLFMKYRFTTSVTLFILLSVLLILASIIFVILNHKESKLESE